MADNEWKRLIVNMALSKTKAGVQDTGDLLFDDFDDTVFADYTTGSNETQKRAALFYETCLKRCLRELKPDFARRFADLGNRITINKEYADYGYLFELPSDFYWLIRQTDESSRKTSIDCDVLDFTEYAHTVEGTDDEVYICTTAHTSVDDTSDGEPPDDDGDSNWTIDEDSEWNAAEWEEEKSYTADTDGKLLGTSTYSNSGGDSAYIEYIPYAQAGINDDPSKYPEEFKHALATLLAMELELDFERRQKLLIEYENYAKPKAREEEGSDEYVKKITKVTDARSNLTVG